MIQKKFEQFNESNDSKREATEIEKEVMLYLNELRESGVTNMFGATPYIQKEFIDIGEQEAKRLLTLWMKNFNEECDYDIIED